MKFVSIIVMLAISASVLAKGPGAAAEVSRSVIMEHITWENKFALALRLAPYLLRKGSPAPASLASREELHKALISTVKEDGAASDIFTKIESLLDSHVFEDVEEPNSLAIHSLDLFPASHILDLSRAMYLLYKEDLNKGNMDNNAPHAAHLLHTAGASNLVVLLLAVLEGNEDVVKFVTNPANTLGGSHNHYEYEMEVIIFSIGRDDIIQFYVENHSENSQHLLNIALMKAIKREHKGLQKILVGLDADIENLAKTKKWRPEIVTEIEVLKELNELDEKLNNLKKHQN